MYKFFFSFTLIFTCKICFAQSDGKEIYKKVYRVADSINNHNNTIHVLSSDIFKIADSLDNLHPRNYFIASEKFFVKDKFNEAAFLYNVGLLRYRYYNAVTLPKNPPKDLDNFELMQLVRSWNGAAIGTYLKTNVDNYIYITHAALDYYKNHDSTFFSRKKNNKKYEAEWQIENNSVTIVEKNRAIYTSSWNAERKQMEKNINEEPANEKQ